MRARARSCTCRRSKARPRWIGAILARPGHRDFRSGSNAGTYYLRYTLVAGAVPSYGMIRVDVLEDPANPVPPIAVKDSGYLRGNETTTLDALQNDVSPGGSVIGDAKW